MSTFVTLIHHDLSRKTRSPLRQFSTPKGTDLRSNEILREYYLQLEPPRTQQTARKTFDSLRTLGGDTLEHPSLPGLEHDQLLTCVAAQLVTGVYTQLLDVYLDQASEAETELEWWGDIERSRLRTAYYLLQSTFPDLFP